LELNLVNLIAASLHSLDEDKSHKGFVAAGDDVHDLKSQAIMPARFPKTNQHLLDLAGSRKIKLK